MTMPGMSSDDVLRELRDVRSDVKVVLSSGYDEQEIAGRFAGREPHGCIQKPYSADKLVERVRRILDGPGGG
jgi:DNA-binding NarL/FixJ family response regulator